MQVEQAALPVFHAHGFEDAEGGAQFVEETGFPAAFPIFGGGVAVDDDAGTDAVHPLI